MSDRIGYVSAIRKRYDGLRVVSGGDTAFSGGLLLLLDGALGGGGASLCEHPVAAHDGDELRLLQPIGHALGAGLVRPERIAVDKPPAVGCPVNEAAARAVVHGDQELVLLVDGGLLGGGGLGLGDDLGHDG